MLKEFLENKMKARFGVGMPLNPYDDYFPD